METHNLEWIIARRKAQNLSEWIARDVSRANLRIERWLGPSAGGETALGIAAEKNWPDGIAVLSKAGSELDAVCNKNGMSAIQVAVMFQSGDAVVELLKQGADPNGSLLNQHPLAMALESDDHLNGYPISMSIIKSGRVVPDFLHLYPGVFRFLKNSPGGSGILSAMKSNGIVVPQE